MAIAFLEIEDRYKLNGTEDTVSVSVTIGDAQTGAYLVFLDRKLKGANKTVSLGKASTLPGKRCIVSTTIVDERDETNWTSVTVTVKEGNNTKVYGPYSKEVAAHLDSICYVITLVINNQ
jgi:hypothetical protein